MLDSFHMAVVYSSAAASAAALYSETFWESSLVAAISLAFSSAGGGGDLLADLLLLRAGSFEFLQRGTANLVGAQHLVDQFDRFATLTLGFLDNVSMFTNELNIKHASQPSAESRH